MLAKIRNALTADLWSNQRRRQLSAVSTMLCKGQSDGKVSKESGQLPKRKQQVTCLKKEHFDVLVIGGGAVGCGCALESVTRGFKTALIEANDFASGDSCKSSKLIEGGSSYLHAAIQSANLQQIFMLQQVLNERATMLTIAPHLNRVQPMLMPIYSPLRLPLYWLGLKMYDAMAGMSNVRGSHFLSKQATLNEFPMLRRNGLLGSLVYYDVQLDDARMCLALAMTAAKHGAIVANYVRLTELLPPTSECGCRTVYVNDMLSKSRFCINTKVIINATGAGTDAIRKLDDCAVPPIAVPNMGTHIALPKYYGSENCGLLFPSNLSEKALTMLPFGNCILVGNVGEQREEGNGQKPTPTLNEVECLLNQTRLVLEDCVRLQTKHVLSCWTGIKPSIMFPATDKNDGKQPNVVPNYLIEVSGNQMITLAGGSWSAYRVMAVDAINTAIESCQLEPHSNTSITNTLLLDGADDYCCMVPLDLVQTYDLPMDVAQHLADTYGSNASQLMAECSPNSRCRLHPSFPYIQAEVNYACQREYACQMVDVIARRLRVAFTDAAAAAQMLPNITSIMAAELSWTENEQKQQLRAARKFLSEQMGLGSIVKENAGESKSICAAIATKKNCPISIVDTAVRGHTDMAVNSRLSAHRSVINSSVIDGGRMAAPLSGENTLIRAQASRSAPVSGAGSVPVAISSDAASVQTPTEATSSIKPNTIVESDSTAAQKQKSATTLITNSELPKPMSSKSRGCNMAESGTAQEISSESTTLNNATNSNLPNSTLSVAISSLGKITVSDTGPKHSTDTPKSLKTRAHFSSEMLTKATRNSFDKSSTCGTVPEGSTADDTSEMAAPSAIAAPLKENGEKIILFGRAGNGINVERNPSGSDTKS